MPIRRKPKAKKPSAKRPEKLDSSLDDDDSQDVRTKLLLDGEVAKGDMAGQNSRTKMLLLDIRGSLSPDSAEYMAKEADDMMAQPAAQPAGVPTGTPMMPCSVSGIMAGASSGALGLVYGAGEARHG